jgi:hypothetical protein
MVLVACTPPAPPEVVSRQELSEVYTIDQRYKSMQGPSATVEITIGDEDQVPELVWVTGYRAEVVGLDGQTRLPPEFMCHSNLSFDAEAHRRLFGWTRRTARRIFTVSQGQEAITFPDGFAMPLMSDEVLTLTTQVLNHNYPDTTLQARVLVTIDYIRDGELNTPMTPLYMRSANALVQLEGDHGAYGTSAHDASVGSMEGMTAGARVIRDDAGRAFAGHWVVPPGRQENTTMVTNWMKVEPDATVHFIAVHLHPFAETVTLRDASTLETKFETRVERFSDRIGLANVGFYSSTKGFELSPDHDYTLESVYDNPTDEDQEAMAVMYLYLRDPQFRKPPGT